MERHKAELQKLKEAEESLTVEFETQRSNWAEKEKILINGYGEIEDMIDGKSLSRFEQSPTTAGVSFRLLSFDLFLAQSSSLVTPSP